MDLVEYNRGCERFHKYMMRYTKPCEEPTLHQMTTLAELLFVCSCCVDFAMWGANQIRIAKSYRCKGLIMGPDGQLIMEELKGPPDYAHWMVCVGGLPGSHEYGGGLHTTMARLCRVNWGVQRDVRWRGVGSTVSV